MIYFKDENGFIYCYDDRMAVTFVYKFTKWKISRESYYELKHTAGVQEITEKEAKSLTNGANIDDILCRYSGETYGL